MWMVWCCMNKKWSFKEIKKTFFVILVSFFILMMVCMSMWWKMQDIIDTQLEHHVAEQGSVLSGIVDNHFDSELQLLSEITTLINMKNGTIPDFLEQEEGVSYGILRINGEATYGEALDFAEYDGIFEAIHGNASVSCGEGAKVLFAVPVYNGNNVKYVLYKLYDGAVLAQRMSFSCLGDKGACAVVDIDGRIVLQTEEGTLDHAFFADQENDSAFETIRKRMNVNASAAALTKNHMGDNVLFAAETDYSGLYIVGYAPVEAVSGDIVLIVPLVLWCFGLLWLLLVIVTIYLLGTEKKVKESDALRQAKQMAEQANRAKSDFLANMSHEIRTPINAVVGMNEMILRECKDDNIREYANNIEIASHNLLSIINDILDFSKIESGKMEIVENEYKLGEVLNDVATMIELKAEQKGLQFEISVDEELPDTLFGDDVRIKQILLNLLNNAVKYTHEGRVKIKVTGEREKDESKVLLKIAVEDTGIGIRKEDISHLFDGFQRLDLNTNRNIEGTGLGLAITHNLVNMMGGEITVESVYGEGSVFKLQVLQDISGDGRIGNFRQNYRKAAGHEHHYENSFVAPDASVLVVDDNRMNLAVVRNLLKKTQIQITSCMSGAEALELMCRQNFDLILLDDMMPEMSGVETLKRSKQMAGNKNMDKPVIALTANAVSGAREKYLAEGFTDYMSKPIGGKELEEKLKKYLQKKLTEEAGEESLPLIDFSLGMTYCGDSEEIYNEILDMYCQQFEEKCEELQHCFREMDWERYTILVHSLKSNSLNIGGKTLSERCLELEMAGKAVRAGEEVETNLSFIKENHAKTMELYAEVISRGKEYLKEKGMDE